MKLKFAIFVTALSLPCSGIAESKLVISVPEFVAMTISIHELRAKLDLLKAAREDAADDIARVEIDRQIARAQERQAELITRISRAQKVLHGTDFSDAQSRKTLAEIAPMISGKILQTRKNFVEISIGSDDGLRVGHLLDVTRDGERGRIIIRRTDPGAAVGEIIPDFQKLPIRVGDHVMPHWDTQRHEE